jgi:hypothetical protein
MKGYIDPGSALKIKIYSNLFATFCVSADQNLIHVISPAAEEDQESASLESRSLILSGLMVKEIDLARSTARPTKKPMLQAILSKEYSFTSQKSSSNARIIRLPEFHFPWKKLS